MRQEMGAEFRREQRNMQEAHRDEPSAPFQVIAVDEDGDELYEAEGAWSENSARLERDACESLWREDPDEFEDAVAGFQIKKTF